VGFVAADHEERIAEAAGKTWFGLRDARIGMQYLSEADEPSGASFLCGRLVRQPGGG
jgi:hypothetical protein